MESAEIVAAIRRIARCSLAVSASTAGKRILEGYAAMCAKREEDSFRDFVLDQLRSLSYYEVPEEIVEDDEELASWAREAAAREGKGRAPVRKRR